MRTTTGLLAVSMVASAGLAACGGFDPARELTPHELRLRALDSLARTHPCVAIHAKLIYDPLLWTERQACAVTGRALKVLGTAEPFRDMMAPSDTAYIVTMSLYRQRFCSHTLVADTVDEGRVGPFEYVVLMEAPHRPHSIGVVLNAMDFTGGAGVDAHPRGVWGGSIHLELQRDQLHPREEGRPCGGNE
jgi:hypothetical protein